MEYILIVNKLSNETGADITISYIEDGLTKEEKITVDSNNKATVRIGNQDEVDITVISKDELAKVSIKESLPKINKETQKIATTEETTCVPIYVIAQDGTVGNYEITIVKASSDNELESLTAQNIDNDDILKTSDNTYLIKMPDTTNEIKLKAIAKSKYATVKIEDGDYSSTNVNEQTVLVDGESKEITICVKSENGQEREYKVTIKKVTDLSLESVKVDDNECYLEDGSYVSFIDRDTKEIALKIKAKNEKALIATKEGTDKNWSDSEAKDIHIKQITITGEETTVLIQAKDPNDESRIKEYSLIIKYKSSNADLELVKVDNKDAIKMEDEYYATTTVDALKSQIFAKAVNKYAKVSINGFDKEEGSSTRKIDLSSEKTTTVIVTVTSQDEKTTNTFNVIIERKSEDASCTILINNEFADETDEQTNTYTKYIERQDTEATVLVTANSEVAMVEMDGESQLHTLAKTITIANEETKLDVIVTAENGEKVIYHVNIIKKSTDNSIKSVKVDGKQIEEQDGKYIATVYDKGKDTQDALIEVIATEEHAKIQIGDGSEFKLTPAQSSVTFKDQNRKITLNINVQAQDTNTTNLTKILLPRTSISGLLTALRRITFALML